MGIYSLLLLYAVLLLLLAGPISSFGGVVRVDITTLVTVTRGRTQDSASKLAKERDLLVARNACNHNNCLRELIRSSSILAPFCATYTATQNTASTGASPFPSQCHGSPSEVSSACSCLVTSHASADSTSGSLTTCVSTASTEEWSTSSAPSRTRSTTDAHTSSAVVSTLNSSSPSPSTSFEQKTASFGSGSVSYSPSAPLTFSIATQSTTSLSNVDTGGSTDTISSTEVFTITSCHPTVTDCPGTSASAESSVSIIGTSTEIAKTSQELSLAGTSSLASSVATGGVSRSSLAPISVSLTNTIPASSSSMPGSQSLTTSLHPASVSGQNTAGTSTIGQSAIPFSFTSTSTDAQGSRFTTIIQTTFFTSVSVSSNKISSTVSAGGPPVSHSAVPFSSTSIDTDTQGSSFTTITQATFPPSTSKFQAQSASITSAAGSRSGVPVFFTTTGTNSKGSLFTSVFQSNVTPTISENISLTPGAHTTSISGSPASHTAFSFSLTTTGTGAQGSLFTSNIQGTFTSSKPKASSAATVSNPTSIGATGTKVPSSFTTTGTNSRGILFTSVIQESSIPSVVNPASIETSAFQTGVPSSFTTIRTDSLGSLFTSVVQASSIRSATNPASARSSLSSVVQASSIHSATNPASARSSLSSVVQASSIHSVTNPASARSSSSSVGVIFPSTTTGADSQASLFTSVIQGSSTPSVTATSPKTKNSLSEVSFTVTSAGTHSQGQPLTSLEGESSTTTLNSISGSNPHSVSVSSGNAPPSTTRSLPLPGSTAVKSASATCSPWPACTVSTGSPRSTTIGSTTCSPWPACWLPTATITTAPPGFSVQYVSGDNLNVTGDTWVTTTNSQGSTTVVPVFIFPDGRDGIIWNLPWPFVNIQWILPGWPELPSFRFPCIFFCPEPGVDGPPPPPIIEGPNPENKSEEPSTSTTSTSTSSSSSSSKSTSTWYTIVPNQSATPSQISAFNNTLARETNPFTLYISEVIEIKFVDCWAQYLNSSQVQTYQQDPAVSGIFTGDNLVAIDYDWVNASSPPGIIERYWPRKDSAFPKRQIYPSDFQQQLGAPPDLVMISQPMPPNGEPVVPLTNLQSFAFLEVTRNLPGVPNVAIFMLDSGADATALENMPSLTYMWAGFPNDPENGQPGGYIYEENRDDLDTEGWHGTCMISKANGPACGVSKNADVYAVVLPKVIPTAQELASGVVTAYRVSTIINGLRQILAEVIHRNLQGRAVVGMPFGQTDILGAIPTVANTQNTPQHFLLQLYNVIDQLAQNGVVVVVSSGNNGGPFNSPPDPHYATAEDAGMPPPGPPNGPTSKVIEVVPALWNSGLDLIVVGAVDDYGVITDFTQYEPNPHFPIANPNILFPNSAVDLWAPGSGVYCTTGNGLMRHSGTSPAAASVVGLVAYVLGQQDTRNKMCNDYPCATPLQIVRSVKGFLQQWSYARNINTLSPDEKYYPRVVWNLANPLLNSGAIACGPNAKRQDGVSTGCSVETANPTITASLPSVKTPTGPLPTLSKTSTKASVSKNPTITASFHTGPYTLTPVSTPLPTFSKTSTKASVSVNPTTRITASLPSVKTPTGPLPTLSTTSTKASVSKNPTITASFHTGPITLSPFSTPLPTFSKTSTKASVSASPDIPAGPPGVSTTTGNLPTVPATSASPDLPAGPPGVSTARKPTTSTTAELRSSSSKK